MPYDRAGECFTCEEGFYCPEKAAIEMTTCPAGSYCGEGAYTHELCPPGTYSNLTHQTHIGNCTDCPPGYYCSDRGAIAPTGLCSAGHICYLNGLFATPVYNDDPSDDQTIITWGDQCHEGKYCPEGTTYMVDCPKGTYLDFLGAESELDCKDCNPGKFCNETGAPLEIGDCWPGFYCTGRAERPDPFDNTTGNVCPKHYYCPSGSYEPVLCTYGTYSNISGLSECWECPPGLICEPETDPYDCPEGYYCLGGADSSSDPLACPRGTFGNRTGMSALSHCSDCIPGHYCETEGLAEPTGLTSAGYWSITRAIQSGPFDDTYSADFSICPEGFYCEEGSGNPDPCPPGSFSSSTHLGAIGECTPCTAGKYCPDYNMTVEAGDCDAGYYCNEGSASIRPTDGIEGDECPTGFYCPVGSPSPVACIAGRYNNETGRSSCRNCPTGYYCPQNSTVPEECPAGYYCPVRTTYAYEYPCPEGTFNNLTGRSEESDCVLCLPGMYCEVPGLDWPTGPCDEGWYCINGSQFAQPSLASQGGRCPMGSYCPTGSVSPFSCLAGMYCDQEELAYPTGNCSAGYYCTGGASVPNPEADLTGDICPSGHYCPAGSFEGTDCPPGTYLNTTGNKDLDDCINCTQGYYCEGYANIYPDDNCAVGYYCPPGQSQTSPFSYKCPQVYVMMAIIVNGQFEPTRCDSGYFQDEEGQGSCKDCPQGYFCDNTKAPVVLYNNAVCPEGHYCPPRTRYDTEFPCPRGTYSNRTGLNETSQCDPCCGGYFCPNEGMTECLDLCYAGYYCKRNAEDGTPSQDPDADLCPMGYYCPNGTADPLGCPPGTYSDQFGLETVDDCSDCTPGYYCDNYAQTQPTAECNEGYYCPAGSDRSDQLDCPAGYYCLNGTFDPTPCPRGTYSNDTNKAAASECYPCSGGFYCETEGLTIPTGECAEGYYCPDGTIYREPNNTFCPVGHYCPGANSYPIPCQNNTYVNYTHAVICLDCPAGYFCKFQGEQEICPMGYVCPAGTGYDLISCPRGTYSDQEGLYDLSQCKPCDAGQYCDEEHLPTPTADCSAGYYCVFGVDRAEPDGDNTTAPSVNESCPHYDGSQTGYGGKCPLGHYCPTGSIFPEPCDAGTYAPNEAMESCLSCPAGYYCPANSSSYEEQPCPSGHYCPEGTEFGEQFKCSPGTFNNLTISNNLTDSGYYCASNGLPLAIGSLRGRLLLRRRSTTATPSGSGGDRCLAGTYCPPGSPYPTPCDGGSYCAADLMTNTSGSCDPGYYCHLRATVPNPNDGNVTGDECPLGAFCPEGSASPLLCDAGYFLNSTHNDEESDCLPCTAGYYCAGSGNPEPTDVCQAGYYCPPGQREPTPPEYNCTLGHYCPAGSTEPVRCNSGYYQDETGQLACKDCPEGYFCDNTFEPVVLYNSSMCPTGFYCPMNTYYATEFPCPRGTFNNLTHRTDLADCQPCAPGDYCDQIGLSEPAGPCDAGFFCLTGSNSSSPTFGDDADECPVGHYCPQGTAQPQACPPGTYSPSVRRQAVEECLNCTAGRYCPTYGMNATGDLCSAGYYCESGADIAEFVPCPQGHYCPMGTDVPEECPPGTWSDQTQLTAENECYNCTAGFYCPTSAMTVVTEICWGGYYCPPGQSSQNPSDYLCPIGVHCPNGSEIYQSCPSGSYANYSGAAECDTCPEGYYCTPATPENATLGYQACPIGYFCPEGTGLDWQPCPAGTYSPSEGLRKSLECLSCDPGLYCQGTHLTAPTGNCSAGYYCTSGVDQAQPGVDNSTINCTCPEQTVFTGVREPKKNKDEEEGEGRVRERERGGLWYEAVMMIDIEINVNWWLFIEGGRGEVEVDERGEGDREERREKGGGLDGLGEGKKRGPGKGRGEIEEEGGYFRGEGGICPVAHYCPEGSSLPLPCDAGTYNDEIAQETCKVCPAGYYCMMNSSEYSSFECPSGHYCPNGTTDAYEFPCPPGTYNGHPRSDAMEACLSCPKGTYCAGYGNSNYTDLCNAGWYCTGGASSSNTTSNGGQCQSGFYCPRGSGEPLACPGGEFCQTSGLPLPTVSAPQGTTAPSPRQHPPHRRCEVTYVLQDFIARRVPGALTMSACSVSMQSSVQSGYYVRRGHLNPSSALWNLPIESWRVDVIHARWDYCDSTGGCSECYRGRHMPSRLLLSNGYQEGRRIPLSEGYLWQQQGLEQEAIVRPVQKTSFHFIGGYYCEAVGQTEPTDLCDAGFYCRQYANTSTPRLGYDADICPQGYYCPEGTAEPFGCPPGTFGGTEGLHNTSSCTPCLAGYYCENYGLDSVQGECSDRYYCPEGSSSRTEVICTTGNYCPLGSDVPTACPEGTFNPYLGLNDTSQCTPCTPGSYCETQGLSAPTDICDEGYYCPEGQNSSRPEDYPCPVAHYCPLNSSEPLPCQNGTYMNHTHAAVCDICRLDDSCPEGYYCPDGTGIDWQSCPRGTFNNETGLQEESQCKDCLGGYYCDQLHMTDVTGPCDPGYYCEYRVDRAKPSGDFNATCQLPGDQTGPGDVCPEGHYCPTGSDQPILCPAGSYANQTGLETCLQCPEGYYCTEGSVIYHDKPCPEGHFCPAGTQSEFENPCPAGTFYNTTMASDVNDCLPCTCGFYCELDGLPEPTGYCAPGWYCNGSSTSNTTTTEGGICQEGTYCPEGSCLPTLCDPGTYCQTDGLDSPTGNCSAGYYCVLGASSPAPNDTTGAVCRVGHYCPEGSEAQMPCPTGYFLNSVGNDALEDCLDCTPGWYCPGDGRELPLALCDAGYYCPLGQNVSSPPSYRCPVGHFCEEGSFAPTRCENGTYQDVEGESSCKECPQGYFCDNTVEPVVLNNDTTRCPSGHYCPPGTRYDTEYPCPIGTFNNLTGLGYISQCSPCLGGYYCPTPGMVYPEDLCAEGFYCKQFANISTPDQGNDANICPPGYFCPEGTDNSRPCPKGTFSDGLGLEKESDCQLCTPGDYCGEVGMTTTSDLVIKGLSSPVDECDGGFYCPPGQSVPNPVEYPCPIGLHCPIGSPLPVPCDPGSFTNLTHAAECLECPAGFYCVPEHVEEGNSTSGFRLCPQGYYCPAGTGRNWTACPPGTYGGRLGLETDTDCTDCPGAHTGYGGVCPIGHYCPQGSELPLGCDAGTYQDEEGWSYCKTCPAGYYCLSNATTYLDTICPEGYYCPSGTEYDLQEPCPEGTFNNLTGAHNISWCTPCLPGWYCQGQGNGYPTDLCDPGWYCTNSSITPQPSDPYQGGECQAGYYCPQGASQPVECDSGSYCDVAGLDQPFDLCKPGYYCGRGSTTGTPSGVAGDRCSPGHYCIEGSEYETMCPPGTYQPSYWAKNITYCLDCLAGKYCNDSGLSQPEGKCDPGFYCPGGQTVSNPNEFRCQEGYYCPLGSPGETPCPAGWYQDQDGQPDCKECLPGFYCDDTNGPVVNYTLYICPEGHYCPNGTQAATQYECPIGTFNNITGLTEEEECSPCLAGYYCGQRGLTYPYTYCSAGYYCRTGARLATPDQGDDANICPVGHYCLEGCTEPVTCPAGTFSNDTGLMNVTECEPCDAGYYCGSDGLTEPTDRCDEGFYCERGSDDPQQYVCPAGKYCPLGTSVPHKCPAGTFSNDTRLADQSECRNCTAGFYCQQTGLTEEEGSCTAGYYCLEGSAIPAPDDCPRGLHCPEGSAVPLSCAAGYFTNRTTQASCQICPDGYYCYPVNATIGYPDLEPGYSDCPAGYYCPEGTGLDLLHCPHGTYSDETNLYKITQCKDCPGGYYCPDTAATNYTQLCHEGYWCQSGLDRGNPNAPGSNDTYNETCPLLGGYTGVGGVCPRGHRCPEGTTLPLGCDAGYYQDQEGEGDCKSCPAGFYCVANSTDYAYSDCPAGYYCPLGTTHATEFPCPRGTFNNATGSTDNSSCLACLGGMYCQGVGNEWPTSNCRYGMLWFQVL
ncbi:hypothetical protein BSL78_27465 [Apostichopus japonicus]|uniref:Chitin-binding type-2 domain-containing protein n=1 Tax=Stichopus japonicus TaxID=307972 RepID=A0A2G8JJ24_STIJA|nr:hypothetical protein BSL78_27465 [Apostichopus japonicus]